MIILKIQRCNISLFLRVGFRLLQEAVLETGYPKFCVFSKIPQNKK